MRYASPDARAALDSLAQVPWSAWRTTVWKPRDGFLDSQSGREAAVWRKPWTARARVERER